MPDWTLLATLDSRMEARIAAGLLQEYGIETLVNADDCAGLHPHFDRVHGVDLLVRPQDLDEARALLATPPLEDEG